MLTRRWFLISGVSAAGVVVLGGCGGDDEPDDGAGGSTTTLDTAKGYGLASFVGNNVLAAGDEIRVAFGVLDTDGLLSTDLAPEQLAIDVLLDDEVLETIAVPRRADGLPRPYYAVRTTIEEPGAYTLRATIDGEEATLAFTVLPIGEVAVIRPGQPMPSVETPTLDDARGVDPICTRDPQCQLHDVSLDVALTEGRPVALIVSTPEFCQVAICGPVLDVLLEVVDSYPDVRFVHAEVYRDPATSISKPEDLAPVMTALKTPLEPLLVLIDAQGVVVDRIDSIYDRGELREVLDRL